MGLINGMLTGLFDLIFRPFLGLNPIWALTVVSFATGILMLWLFGKVSNQDAIKVVRDRIRGNLLGIRLFGDDLGLLARLQGRILRQTGVYLRYAAIPLVVMLVPVVLILIQLDLRYGARPLEPGERTMLKATLRDGFSVTDPVTLEVPEGITVETPGVRIPSLREVAWRIRADEPGRHRLVVTVGGESVEKEVRVGSDWGSSSKVRSGRLLELVLHPGESPIDSRRIASVSVRYAPLPLELFGFGVNWLLFFFIASLVFGFAFRRALGVEI